jgi:hypothetical protein
MKACVDYSTESLSTTTQKAIVMRGTENDTNNIIKLCLTKKYWNSSEPVKQATLEKYFDINTLFGTFTKETLPTRYLRTYYPVEDFWTEH